MMVRIRMTAVIQAVPVDQPAGALHTSRRSLPRPQHCRTPTPGEWLSDAVRSPHIPTGRIPTFACEDHTSPRRFFLWRTCLMRTDGRMFPVAC